MKMIVERFPILVQNFVASCSNQQCHEGRGKPKRNSQQRSQDARMRSPGSRATFCIKLWPGRTKSLTSVRPVPESNWKCGSLFNWQDRADNSRHSPKMESTRVTNGFNGSSAKVAVQTSIGRVHTGFPMFSTKTELKTKRCTSVTCGWPGVKMAWRIVARKQRFSDKKTPSLPCKARANPTPSQTLRKCLAAGSEFALQLLTKTEPSYINLYSLFLICTLKDFSKDTSRICSCVMWLHIFLARLNRLPTACTHGKA